MLSAASPPVLSTFVKLRLLIYSRLTSHACTRKTVHGRVWLRYTDRVIERSTKWMMASLKLKSREGRKRNLDQEEESYEESATENRRNEAKSSASGELGRDSDSTKTRNGCSCDWGIVKPRLQQTINIDHIDEDYFRCYADIRIHEQMLSDKVRTLAYRHALLQNKCNLKGATVLDVGAGTGILSQFAVQAGASKVFAVEPTRIAHFAKQICSENGNAESISVIQSKIEDTSIPIEVDAIVSEWMGYSLLYESMLQSVLWARDHYLKPSGEMYPCKASLFLAPINDEAIHERLNSWKQMKDLYGVSMASLEPLTKQALTARADSLHLDMESVLANACCLCHFDLKTMTVHDAQQVQENFKFTCYGSSLMHGFATWFTVTFPGGVIIDTSPYALPTHWGQTMMYLEEPISVQQDTEIDGSYRMQTSEENPRFWDIVVEFQVNRGKKISQHWQCAD
ncbi:hypothetical protein RRG08_062249 [Elysia crispata]|uniref:Protein arginine N-methyltransferase 6 n=1 Tax=Elysia crispata TaxID=231223 RepID=A0AAE0YG86_9GAST|nr:hypothetical protein RRG08_062249 [Elysia crispata]